MALIFTTIIQTGNWITYKTLLLLMTFIRHKLRQRSKCAKSVVAL